MLTHRNLDRHSDDWEGIRDAMSSRWSLDGLPTTLAADQPPPRISDDQIQARLGRSAANTMVVLLPTDPDQTRTIFDGVTAGIFTFEIHPIRKFPGSTLP